MPYPAGECLLERSGDIDAEGRVDHKLDVNGVHVPGTVNVAVVAGIDAKRLVYHKLDVDGVDAVVTIHIRVARRCRNFQLEIGFYQTASRYLHLCIALNLGFRYKDPDSVLLSPIEADDEIDSLT